MLSGSDLTTILSVDILRAMTMDALTPTSGHGESHIKSESPCASPEHIQDPSDSTISESLPDIYPEKLETDIDLMVNTKLENPQTRPSATHSSSLQASEAPPTPENDINECEPMSPSDRYSIHSSPQTFGWPSSSESGDSEPWPLHCHELLPDNSAYAHSPSSPASGWDSSIPYNFQAAPTSAGYFPDCSLPFSASTPPMQTNYSPVFEMESNFGSPQHLPGHFGHDFPMQQRPIAMGPLEMGNMANEPTSHPNYSRVIATPPSDYCEPVCQSPALGLTEAKNGDINNLPYSQLLYRAFMSSETRRMPLQAIYDWFKKNTDKPSKNNGWQNSIRHNLSMNQAFQKAPLKEDRAESRRATEWVLADFAIKQGVESTTRYRTKTHSRPKHQSVGRERTLNSSYHATRSGSGYNSRSRAKFYGRQPPLHGLPAQVDLFYGSHTPPNQFVAPISGLPDVEGYLGPTAGLGYSPVQPLNGYNGLSPDGTESPDSYSMYNLSGETVGNYAIVGGVADSTLAGTHASGVVPPAAPYGAHLSAGLAGQIPLDQHQNNYAPADYGANQGIKTEPEDVRQ